jgi:L-seryl-tRNA(Ser) seleniumtransferase
VGTTNRTRVDDFEEPLASGRARLIVRVHPSNFVIAGFTEAPDSEALAALAHRHGAIVVDDLGSGALLPTERYGLAHEPMPSERLAAGADLVTFSGDKLLGGPQTGLIVGRADLIARLRRDPLARASRPDKTTLAALGATLGLYRAGLAQAEVPVWRMIAADPANLGARARAIRDGLPAQLQRKVTVEPLESTIGGGSLPGEILASFGLLVRAGSASRLLSDLRRGDPCIVARIADGAVVLDLRTVEPAADPDVLRAIAGLIGQ